MGDGEMSRRNPRDRRVKMLRLWLRGLRKMSRREADARKREGRQEMRRRQDKILSEWWGSDKTWEWKSP
jgi:hypothetical protein